MRYAFLLRELVRRDLEARYRTSWLGFAWPFVHPLAQLVLFSFVFSTVMRISLIGERTDSFALFLFAGLLPWMGLNEGLTRATTAITDNAALVSKIPFPAVLLVVTVVVAALVHQGVAAVLYLGVLAAFGSPPGLHVFWMAPALLIQIALTLGGGLALAALQVWMRDVAQVLSITLMAWFYVTPIVYPLGLVPARYAGWLEWNPLTVVVTLYRRALLGGPLPPAAATVAAALAATLVLWGGLVLFRRLEPGFVDEV